MYLFVDTEYVPGQDGRGLLLSIGLCGPRAQEFYAEHSVEVPDAADNFLATYVLPQLGRIPCLRGSLREIGVALQRWLHQFEGMDVEVCYDYSADREAFEDLVGMAAPGNCALVATNHIGYLLEDPDGIKAADACWAELSRTRGVERHHALADALALRARFCAVHGYEA